MRRRRTHEALWGTEAWESSLGAAVLKMSVEMGHFAAQTFILYSDQHVPTNSRARVTPEEGKGMQLQTARHNTQSVHLHVRVPRAQRTPRTTRALNSNSAARPRARRSRTPSPSPASPSPRASRRTSRVYVCRSSAWRAWRACPRLRCSQGALQRLRRAVGSGEWAARMPRGCGHLERARGRSRRSCIGLEMSC